MMNTNSEQTINSVNEEDHIIVEEIAPLPIQGGMVRCYIDKKTGKAVLKQRKGVRVKP